MKRMLRAFGLAAALAVCAAAQPTISTNGIVNGASFVYATLPNGNIAQGSIFSIFGTNIGPAAAVNASAFPLPTDQGLGGVTVQVTPGAGGNAINAILLMASSGQINAILPSTVPVGTANVTVKFNSGTSNAQQITVVKSSFGTFAANSQGKGPAALLNFKSDSEQPQNAVDQPAKPGQVVILWGTGLGPVTFDETQAPGANAKDMKDDTGVMVSVGGVSIKPQYAGRSPQFAGVDQVNFQVPDNIAAACYIPVIVKVNGVVSNTTSMSVAAGSATTCSDDLTEVPATIGQGLRTGSIVLQSTRMTVAGQSLSFDSGIASFTKVAPTDIGKISGTFGVSTYGACNVFTYKGDNATFVENIPVTYLDAGTPLTLTLPDNTTKLMTQSPLVPGVYSIQMTPGPVLPPPFLVKGTYKIDVPGGSGQNPVGKFSASLDVPDPLTWTNMSTIPSPIPRNTGLQITWSGGDPNDAVLIFGNSAMSDKTGAGFYCLAKGKDLQFTVPADVLSALPPSTGTGEQATGFLAVGDFPTLSKFNVTPVPSGLDSAGFAYQFLSGATVSYQ